MSQNEAKAIGAMALFGEKYGDQVRVVSVGDWAKELCGGTHVSRSGELGLVKLLSESSIGAGVRRVEALVGHDAYKYLAKEHLLLNSLTEILKGSKVEELPQRISDLLDKVKVMEKEIASARSAKAMDSVMDLVKKAQNVKDFTLIIDKLDDEISVEDLRAIAVNLKTNLGESVVALASISSEKPVIVVATSELPRNKGIKAGALAKIASGVLGGGGGGKDDFAQGGGVMTTEIPNALIAIEKALTN